MTEQEGAEALLTFMRDEFILPASYEDCWEGIMFQNIFPCMLTGQFVVGIYPAEAVIKIRVTNHQMGEGTIDDKICRRLIDNRTVDDNAICTLLINNIPNGFLRMRFIRDIHERHGIAVTCKLCENAAHDIDHDFWRAFRKAVREEKEDAFLIGEIWEDSEAWLRGDQMDSTMNYQFADIARDFFAEGKITLKEFADRISRMYFRYREPVAEVQMNFLDTHDVPRFLSYCKQDKKKLVFAMAFMMTFAGIPSIFYGDEYGVFGETESEYRKPMPWTGGDEEVYAAYRYWIHERREHPALSRGRFRILEVDEEKGILRFLRYIPENRELDMEVILDCKNLKCMVNEITR